MATSAAAAGGGQSKDLTVKWLARQGVSRNKNLTGLLNTEMKASANIRLPKCYAAQDACAHSRYSFAITFHIVFDVSRLHGS